MADDAPKKRGRPKKSEAPKEIDWAEELGQQMDALATQQREASKFAADFLKKQQRIREANEKARQKAELAALKAEEALAKAQIEEEEARKKAAEQRSQEIAKFLARQKEQQKNRDKELKAERESTLDAETKLAEEQLKQEEESQKQLNQTQKKLEKLEKKRSKVIDDLTKKFGSSNVAKIFAGKYVGKDGKISQEGKFTAKRMQDQDRFIRKLVRSLGTLPIFQKAGRAFQQFGTLMLIRGVSQWRHGEKLAGAGSIAGGLGIMALPVLALKFADIIGRQIAKGLVKLFLKGDMWGKVFRAGQGIKGGLSTAGQWIGNLAKSPIGKGTVGGALLPAILGLLGGISLWSDSENIKKEGKGGSGILKGMAVGTIAAGVASALAVVVGSTLAVPLAAIGTALFALGKAVQHPEWFDQLKTLIYKIPGIKPVTDFFGKVLAPKVDKPYTKEQIAAAKLTGVPVKDVSATQPHEIKSTRFRILQFGSSAGETGTTKVPVGQLYSKEALESMARKGGHGIEPIRTGGGVTLADTFYNDARVGRTGSSALLQAAQARMAAKGYGGMLITSAMASRTSSHALGLRGHGLGQKFDIDASGMSEAQAVQYAKDLYSTGYFSHAEAEYDKKTKQWHIDARISDKAYEVYEKKQQEQYQQRPTTPTKSSSIAKEPPGTDKFTPIPSVNSQGNVKGGQFCAVNY